MRAQAYDDGAGCAAANFTIVQILLMMFPERERIAILIGIRHAVAKFLLY